MVRLDARILLVIIIIVIVIFIIIIMTSSSFLTWNQKFVNISTYYVS